MGSRYIFKGVRHFNAILKVIVRLNYKHTRFVSAAHASAISSEKKNRLSNALSFKCPVLHITADKKR